MQRLDHNQVDSVFSGFPHSEYWKLFVDYSYWHLQDPFVFDKHLSSNYNLGMVQGLQSMLSTINDSLSIYHICLLHDLSYRQAIQISSYGFSPKAASGIGPLSCTLNGFKELLLRISTKNVPVKFFQQMVNSDNHTVFLALDYENQVDPDLAFQDLQQRVNQNQQICLLRETSLEDICDFINDEINEYYEKISTHTADSDFKIKTIVKFIQNVHQYHPFSDGNGRIFIFLLLNKLLIQNNLSWSIIKNPGDFTGYSVDELVLNVKEGQQLFAMLKVPGSIASQPSSFENFLFQLSNSQPKIVDLDNLLADLGAKFINGLEKNSLEESFEALIKVPDLQIIQFLESLMHKQDDENHQESILALIDILDSLAAIGIAQDRRFIYLVVVLEPYAELVLETARQLKTSDIYNLLDWQTFIIAFAITFQPESINSSAIINLLAKKFESVFIMLTQFNFLPSNNIVEIFTRGNGLSAELIRLVDLNILSPDDLKPWCLQILSSPELAKEIVSAVELLKSIDKLNDPFILVCCHAQPKYIYNMAFSLHMLAGRGMLCSPYEELVKSNPSVAREVSAYLISLSEHPHGAIFANVIKGANSNEIFVCRLELITLIDKLGLAEFFNNNRLDRLLSNNGDSILLEALKSIEKVAFQSHFIPQDLQPLLLLFIDLIEMLKNREPNVAADAQRIQLSDNPSSLFASASPVAEPSANINVATDSKGPNI